MPIAQSGSNFTPLPFTPQAAAAALQLLPKATRAFIKLHVNAYIWGSCRNVLLLSLRVLFNPPPCPEMCRGTSTAPSLRSATSPACAVLVPPGSRGRVLGLGRVWVRPLGPPRSLPGFVPPSGIGMPHALGQVAFRASLLLMHFARFILASFLLGLNQAGTDVNRPVISC